MKRVLLVLSAAVFLVMLLSIGLPEVWGNLRGIRLRFLFLVIFLQVTTVLLIAHQWQIAAKQLGLKVPFWQLLSINLLGSVVEGITPSVKAGGEAVKVMLLRQEVGLETAHAIALVSLQKLISVVPFLSLCALGVVWLVLTQPLPASLSYLLLSSLVLLGVALAAITVLFRKTGTIIERHWRWQYFVALQGKLRKGLPAWRQSWKQALTDRRLFTYQAGLSMVLWLLFGLKAHLLATGLGVQLGFVQAAVATYLAYMVAMLPLSPGGLGSFEGSMVAIVAGFGLASTDGLGFALAVRGATFWLVFLVGCIWFIIKSIWASRNHVSFALQTKRIN